MSGGSRDLLTRDRGGGLRNSSENRRYVDCRELHFTERSQLTILVAAILATWVHWVSPVPRCRSCRPIRSHYAEDVTNDRPGFCVSWQVRGASGPRAERGASSVSTSRGRVSHPSHTQFTLCQEMSIVAERGNGNNTQISTTPGCMIVSILMLMDLFRVGKRKHSSICRS